MGYRSCGFQLSGVSGSNFMGGGAQCCTGGPVLLGLGIQMGAEEHFNFRSGSWACGVSECVCRPDGYTLLRGIEQVCGILLIS